MEFDIRRVYSAVNADEVKVGSKVIVADTMSCLRSNVEYEDCHLTVIKEICEENCQCRFRIMTGTRYLLAYLVEEPSEKKLKWTDLKIGDVISHKTDKLLGSVTGIDSGNVIKHICVSNYWLTDEDLADFWEKVE